MIGLKILVLDGKLRIRHGLYPMDPSIAWHETDLHDGRQNLVVFSAFGTLTGLQKMSSHLAEAAQPAQ